MKFCISLSLLLTAVSAFADLPAQPVIIQNPGAIAYYIGNQHGELKDPDCLLNNITRSSRVQSYSAAGMKIKSLSLIPDLGTGNQKAQLEVKVIYDKRTELTTKCELK